MPATFLLLLQTLLLAVYSHFTISSLNCPLHTALAHVINVLGIVESQMPNVIVYATVPML